MSAKTPKNKHMKYEDRCVIEDFLNRSKPFSKIALRLGKDRTTVAKEVRAHRYMCPGKLRCAKTDEPPYVCNGCPEKGSCRRTKYLYRAHSAQNEYEKLKRESREGARITQAQAEAIDARISPLMVERHHSVNQVYVNHRELLPFAKSTFYSYIGKGLFDVRNVDLPRKVKFRVKKEYDYGKERCDVSAKIGRFHRDFLALIEKNADLWVAEMDTVIGTRGGQGGKCLLTIMFRATRLMLIRLLPYKKAEFVNEAFSWLKKALGDAEFSRLFGTILADNGTEFSDPETIESSEKTGEKICSLYYCDPNCSWQKGTIEKNHEYVRMVLPKGTSFASLTQEDADKLASHINSVPRDSLNGRTPYEASEALIGKETLGKLGIHKVEPDEVNLTRKLLGG